MMMKTKPSYIYGWDEEPVDERPSEFSSTQGHSGLSGYHSTLNPPRVRKPPSRVGLKAMLTFCAVLIMFGGFALAKFAALLKA